MLNRITVIWSGVVVGGAIKGCARSRSHGGGRADSGLFSVEAAAQWGSAAAAGRRAALADGRELRHLPLELSNAFTLLGDEFLVLRGLGVRLVHAGHAVGKDLLSLPNLVLPLSQVRRAVLSADGADGEGIIGIGGILVVPAAGGGNAAASAGAVGAAVVVVRSARAASGLVVGVVAVGGKLQGVNRLFLLAQRLTEGGNLFVLCRHISG